MSGPLMPKATAAWLIDNTMLTFDQIANFCALHPLEIQALADGEVNAGIIGADPIACNELSREEIERCEKTSTAQLKMLKSSLPKPRARSKGPRYTPVTKRAEKPNAIAFLIKQYPLLADVQIAKLCGSTKPTVKSIRDRTHVLSSSLKPVDPVSINLCSKDELDKALLRAERKEEREAKKTAKAAKEAAAVVEIVEDETTTEETTPVAETSETVEETKTETEATDTPPIAMMGS